MKKLILFFAIACISFSVKAANPAIDFVSQLADEILSDVIASDKSQEEKENLFRAAFVKAVDLKGIGQFVLGTSWRRASEEERNAFLESFTDLTVKTWSKRFDLYTGQEIVFQGTRNAERKQIFVDSVIQDAQPVEVTWRLRTSKDTYKIVDIIIENVSMASTYRNEYRSFLQQHNNSVSELAEALRIKSEELDSKKNN